ncbi:MAG: sodium:solute symporter [Planctomycetales bacterium]|nr:sodium:solute symporter [Planctomycetales bacterium]
MPDAAVSPGYGTLTALIVFILASLWLGALANRVVRKSSFVKGYFLGNRGLGAWALALTATVQSGGTFMGFPSLVYSHGWIVGLWIGSYMMVPLASFCVMGKRLAQLSRLTGAITVPDLFRQRFGSPALGLTASLFILFYMTSMMIAQFKAGATVMQIAWPGSGFLSLSEDAVFVGGMPTAYYVGLAVFSVTVIGYTLFGGFLAAVWTDLFQSVMMIIGVVILFFLAMKAAGGTEAATLAAVKSTGDGFAFGPGYAADGRQFLPLTLAMSFFFTWVYGGIGSPSALVRVMACKNTATIRRSVFLLSVYNSFIYIPLIMICVCGRALIPDLPPGKTDELIPRLAMLTTHDLFGGELLAGLILAAPFGAVMATVSSYLVVIASGIVRDVYQRFLNTEATPFELKRLTYCVMFLVGLVAVGFNISPVAYLQAVVVFSVTGTSSTFVVPAIMLAFWRRATVPGVLSAMIVGSVTVLALYLVGFASPDPMIGNITKFRPYFLGGIDPIVWGLATSLLAGVGVSLMTSPPPEKLISQLFDRQEPANVG